MLRKTITLLILSVMATAAMARDFTLDNGRMRITVDERGQITELSNCITGQNYVTDGYMWRMYYDAPYEKEIEILGSGQKARVSSTDKAITVHYLSLSSHGRELDMRLTLTIGIENDKIRFGSEIENLEGHTVIRELQYPLLHGITAPSDHCLYTSEAGGMLFRDPVKTIGKVSSSPYKKPEQIFRQRDVKYGAKVFMNCFALIGPKQGLYFGSHDPTFQDTWHGLRVYRSESGEFDCLEMGFYKYPHCFAGERWECNANVIAPYSGTWHHASQIYRRWVNTWWDHRPAPEWLRTMNSWQRVIFKHQYGEYFYRYPDMNGCVREAGDRVGANALFLFGWWKEGMDHGNPDYTPDDTQGGDEALKEEIRKYQAAGNHLILYYNGKLIDRESRYYLSGLGPKVCRHDNTGSEILERYKFTGQGTWLGEYDQRTFAVATMMDGEWNKVLFALQDRAHDLGAHSVFFDQLGYIEKESTNWDCSREYPVPDVFGIRKRAEVLKLLRSRYAESDPGFALGAEGTVDALCQYCDFTHGYPANDGPERWINFFRFTFPEIIFTDRGQRDDVDAVRHVNNTVLDGQRNDIEIWRCRGLVTSCPQYAEYLARVNRIKQRYADCLLKGAYTDILGFESSNPDLDCRSFVSDRRVAIVVANQRTDGSDQTTVINVRDAFFKEGALAGNGTIEGTRVTLPPLGLAVLVFERR